MMSWRMIDFPGASASHHNAVDEHGAKDRRPMSVAAIGVETKDIVHS